jgi:hypothetical protein
VFRNSISLFKEIKDDDIMCPCPWHLMWYDICISFSPVFHRYPERDNRKWLGHRRTRSTYRFCVQKVFQDCNGELEISALRG